VLTFQKPEPAFREKKQKRREKPDVIEASHGKKRFERKQPTGPSGNSEPASIHPRDQEIRILFLRMNVTKSHSKIAAAPNQAGECCLQQTQRATQLNIY
jgi:hypothetical protein